MKQRLCLVVLFLFVTAFISGCSSTGSYVSTEKVKGGYSGKIVKRNMHYEGIKRNPVIIVHGFQGARLVDSKTDKVLWGDFSASDAFYISKEDMHAMAHPMDKNKKLNELKDDVVPQTILKDINITILGVPLKFPAYEILIEELQKAGYQPEDRPLTDGKNYYTLFEFSYDWRKDLPSNTVRLERFIKEKRAYLQEKYKSMYDLENFDVQFDIIAHSMGGLLSRYYLQYGTQDLPEDGSLPKLNWSGNAYIDRLIICGTPNAGYLDTFIELLRGGELKTFTPAILGTLATYYQMLPAPCTKSIVYSDAPNGKPVNIFEPELWKKMKWGLMDAKADETLKKILPEVKTKEERTKIAYDHLIKCLARAKQFIRAMKVPGTPPEDIELYLVLGYGVKTSRRAHINRKTGKIEKIDYSSGDGKVLATSAMWDKRACGHPNFFLKTPIDWHNILAVRAAHMGILDSDVFVDNILFLLPMIESPKQKEILDKK
jgi:hypothetical protein